MRLNLELAEFSSSLNSWSRLVLVSCLGLELLGLLGELAGLGAHMISAFRNHKIRYPERQSERYKEEEPKKRIGISDRAI